MMEYVSIASVLTAIQQNYDVIEKILHLVTLCKKISQPNVQFGL